MGANATVEVFELTRGSDRMIHVNTVADTAIATPNKVAATGDGGFLLTNDKSSKRRRFGSPMKVIQLTWINSRDGTSLSYL